MFSAQQVIEMTREFEMRWTPPPAEGQDGELRLSLRVRKAKRIDGYLQFRGVGPGLGQALGNLAESASADLNALGTDG